MGLGRWGLEEDPRGKPTAELTRAVLLVRAFVEGPGLVPVVCVGRECPRPVGNCSQPSSSLLERTFHPNGMWARYRAVIRQHGEEPSCLSWHLAHCGVGGSTRKPLVPRHSRGFAWGLAHCWRCQRGGCSSAWLMVLGRDLQVSTSVGLEGSWVGNLLKDLLKVEYSSVPGGLFLVCM